MNVDLLKKIGDIIRESPPEKFTMGTWHCGTAHCIGGWAVVLAGREAEHLKFLEDIMHLGEGYKLPKEILDLTEVQANHLFHLVHWRYDWREKYLFTRDREKHKVAADYINHFIKIYENPIGEPS